MVVNFIDANDHHSLSPTQRMLQFYQINLNSLIKTFRISLPQLLIFRYLIIIITFLLYNR